MLGKKSERSERLGPARQTVLYFSGWATLSGRKPHMPLSRASSLGKGSLAVASASFPSHSIAKQLLCARTSGHFIY